VVTDELASLEVQNAGHQNWIKEVMGIAAVVTEKGTAQRTQAFPVAVFVAAAGAGIAVA
jgi:hypothetical protein